MGVSASVTTTPRTERSQDSSTRVLPYWSMFQVRRFRFVPMLGRPDYPLSPISFAFIINRCPMPRDIHRRFPPVDHSVGRLLRSFVARPPGMCYARRGKASPDQVIHKVDVVFMPQDEARLFVSAGHYACRAWMSLLRLNNLFDGLLAQWTLDRDGQRCQILKGTRSPECPGISLSSCGRYLAWPAPSGFVLFDRYSAAFTGHSKLETGESIKAIAFSPSGRSLAAVVLHRRDFKLRLIGGHSNQRALRSLFQVNLTSIEPSFAVFWNFKEQVLVRWSSDESTIGVSSSEGHLLLISRDRGGPPPMVVTPSFLAPHWSETRLASVRAFDFSPLAHFGETQVVAFVSTQGVLHLFDIHRSRPHGSVSLFPPSFQPPETSFRAVKFSKTGRSIAIGDDEGRVLLLDSDSLDVLMELEFSPLASRLPRDNALSGISSLAFSFSDRYLAAGCSDGTVKVWCLRIDHETLMQRSRRVIRERCSLGNIRRLPLPESIIAFLQDTLD